MVKDIGNKKVKSAATERREQFLKEFFSRKPVWVGFAIIVVMVICAVFAPLIAPYDPYEQDLLNALKAPGGGHLF